MPPSNRELQDAVYHWLTPMTTPENAISATLTFRQKINGQWINAEIAQSAVKAFLRRLDAAAYGKKAIRHRMKLGAIAVREGGGSAYGKHIHYHLQLQVPNHWTRDRWKIVASTEWTSLEWAGPKEHRFDDVLNDGWISYILKLRDKPEYIDAVDFENLRLFT